MAERINISYFNQSIPAGCKRHFDIAAIFEDFFEEMLRIFIFKTTEKITFALSCLFFNVNGNLRKL